MYEYQNATDQDLVLPEIGVVKAGGTITSGAPIENPNLKLLKGATTDVPAASAPAATSPTPAADPTPAPVQAATPAPAAPVQAQEQPQTDSVQAQTAPTGGTE